MSQPSLPKLGYLCLSENPSGELARALIRQFVLVREADRMGYDDIWIGEHHDDARWPQAAISVLLGHLAAVTSKARIGSLVMQPALRDAHGLAEDIATLDLLSKGRLEVGVGSGAAMRSALEARGLTAETARQRLRATMDAVVSMLAAPAPADTALVPKSDSRLRYWLAADDEASLRWAAQRGWGLVAAATHTPERVQRAARIYAEACGGRPPELILVRYACTAATSEEAHAMANPYLEMRVAHARSAGWGLDPSRSIAQSIDALASQSLIGSHAEVARRFKTMGVEFGATRIAIAPTSGQFDTHKHILADFVDEVRPLFDE